MAIIEIKNITKVYNSSQIPVHALNGIDLQIEPGEFTAIVGPSGSGKTTLLNVLGGLDEPTSGNILINDIDLFALNQRQLTNFRLHHIGFVFQSYNLIPVLTAQENIEFILQIQGIPSSQCKQRSLELLEAVRLV